MTTLIDIRNTVQKDANTELAERWSQVAGRLASTLAGHPVSASVDPRSIAPAWSTADRIWFSQPQLPDIQSAQGALALRGLTLHETAHILFTPRIGSAYHTAMKSEGLWSYSNMLEDMRIETLMVGRYGVSASRWLTATMLQYLLDDVSTLDVAFPLIHGRKYLPLTVRQTVRDAFKHQSIATELASVIDAYRACAMPRDEAKAIDLVREYARLLKSVMPAKPDAPTECGIPSPNHSEGQPQDYDQDWNKGQPTAKEQDEYLDDADKQSEGETATNNSPADEQDDADTDTQSGAGQDSDEQDSDEDGCGYPAPAGSGEDSDEDGQDGSGAGQDGQDADQQGQGQDGQGEAQDGQSDTTSDTPTNSVGSGDETDSSADRPVDTDAIRDALDAVLDQLAPQIELVQEQLGLDAELRGNGQGLPQQGHSGMVDLPVEALNGAVDFHRELERLKANYEPFWERETSFGRLNVARAMRGVEPDRAFDAWQEGLDDVTAIECVIALDVSGSMGMEGVTKASQAMWQIKSALDMIGDANCTVVTFDNTARTLYTADEQAERSAVRFPHWGGGTHAKVACQTAVNVLAQSDKPIKLFFAITDGAWSDADQSDELIADLRNANVVTALGFIGASDTASVDAHGCEVVGAIANSSQLAKLGRDVVNYAIDRNISR
jgi:hypothetical protein